MIIIGMVNTVADYRYLGIGTVSKSKNVNMLDPNTKWESLFPPPLVQGYLGNMRVEGMSR